MAWTTDENGDQYWLDDYVPPTDTPVLHNDPVDDNQSTAETNRLRDANADPSSNGIGNISPGSAVDGTHTATWDNIAKAIGLTDKNGHYSLESILGTFGKGATLAAGLTYKPQPMQSVAQLRAGMPSMNTAPMWTPEQMAFGTRPMQTGSALQRVYAADMPPPITPGAPTTGAKHFASGRDAWCTNSSLLRRRGGQRWGTV